MAHTPSAKKRVRQNERRRQINQRRKSRIRTFVKKVEKAIRQGDQEGARAAFRDAQPEIMRGVNKGAIHRNKARRKLSRLSQRIKALG